MWEAQKKWVRDTRGEMSSGPLRIHPTGYRPWFQNLGRLQATESTQWFLWRVYKMKSFGLGIEFNLWPCVVCAALSWVCSQFQILVESASCFESVLCISLHFLLGSFSTQFENKEKLLSKSHLKMKVEATGLCFNPLPHLSICLCDYPSWGRIPLLWWHAQNSLENSVLSFHHVVLGTEIRSLVWQQAHLPMKPFQQPHWMFLT